MCACIQFYCAFVNPNILGLHIWCLHPGWSWRKFDYRCTGILDKCQLPNERKAEYWAANLKIQSSVLQDPSEIILIFSFGAQETFLITVEIAVLLNIFEENIKKKKLTGLIGFSFFIVYTATFLSILFIKKTIIYHFFQYYKGLHCIATNYIDY